MIPDLYAILGVKRSASQEEIRKAFRALAIQHHPDKNGGSAKSTELFKRINAANAVLSDPEKRARYDLATRPFHVEQVFEYQFVRPAWTNATSTTTTANF